MKGDVARMLFYMAVRYEGDNGEPDLELVDEVNTYDLNEAGKGYHGKLSILLEWHKEDPVDSFEINRNNIIYNYQENRNPFIDHPEYVDMIWSGLTSTGAIESKELKIYPNPVTDYLNIEMPDNKTGWVYLYKMNGEIVLKSEITGNYKLSTSNIKSGLYLLKVLVGNHVYISKLVIDK